MKVIMSPQNASLHTVNNGSILKNDRRASKPLMEKRRRERINKSLNELKSILLNALRKDQSTCHSKLEKADILEMTVRYLRSIQRQRMNPGIPLEPQIMNKFRSGYIECKNEVSHFLDSSAENVQPDVKARLMNHLGNGVPQGHIPPQMIGQSPRLLTTAPPVSVVNAISPLQIQLTPNTQMQQAMAAAAAAFSQGRPFMHQGSNGMHPNSEPESDARYSGCEFRPSPEPLTRNSENVKHVRRISESSFASSGFASSSSPVAPSPSASPKKHYLSKFKAQESVPAVSEPLARSVSHSESDANRLPQNFTSVHQQRPLIASPNSPCPRYTQHECTPERSYSPSSSISDNDSDSVWRPW